MKEYTGRTTGKNMCQVQIAQLVRLGSGMQTWAGRGGMLSLLFAFSLCLLLLLCVLSPSRARLLLCILQKYWARQEHPSLHQVQMYVSALLVPEYQSIRIEWGIKDVRCPSNEPRR